MFDKFIINYGVRKKMKEKKENMTSDAVKAQINIARVIFIGLLIGQFMFYFFIQYIISSRSVFLNEAFTTHWLYMSLPFFIIGGYLLALFYGKKRKERLKRIKGEIPMASHYRETGIAQCVIMELVNLFAVLVALMTFSLIPFVFFGLGLMLFFSLFPSEKRYTQLTN